LRPRIGRGWNRMGTGRRGLASATEETRRRVARAGGLARARNPEGLRQAGKKGGEAVKEKYGPRHFERIGRKGGETVARERGRKFYSEIGRRGGVARAEDREGLRRAGRKGAEARWGSR
jgi:general stress protein YciG